jgi:hypothetical protein
MAPSSSTNSSPSSPTMSPSTLSFRSPLQNTRTEDVFQSIVKGCKSWKTLRGGEVVWPPELEAVIEGAGALPKRSVVVYNNSGIHVGVHIVSVRYCHGW